MKKLITNYTFNATAKTITFGDYGTISLESVLLVTNVTDGIIIYNFADPNKGGTVATNVLTLEYDTSSMDNADKLQVYYDDPAATQAISALPAGTNNIGDVDVLTIGGITPANGNGSDTNALRVTLANNSTGVLTSIGAITSQIVPGTGATNLGKAEDAAHSSGDVGVMALAVRQDSEVAMAGASGDYIPLMTDASGKLRTSVAGTVVHDATDAGAPVKIGGKASSSAPADVAAGDRTDAYFDLKGRLKVDGSDVTQPVSASSLPLPSGAATSANQSTGNTSLATIAGAVAGTEMQVDVLTLPSIPAGSNNIGDVDIASSVLPTGAATSALQTTGNSTLSAIDTKLDGTLDVAIVSGGGGGVQYTSGDIDATPTGNVIMWRNSASDTIQEVLDTQPLPVVDEGAIAEITNVTAALGNLATESTVSGLLQEATFQLSTADDGDNLAAKLGLVIIGGKDGGGLARQIATDTDGQLQVDVLSMPTTTVQSTNLDIRDLTNADVITAELSAVDNAVLDSIDAAVNGTIDVAIVSGGGGGTQYAEASTTAPATGTAALGRYVASPAGTLTDGQMSMPLMDNYGQLKVVPVGTVTVQATDLDIRNLASGQDSVEAVQSGTWTVNANAGTNLNTSALALESGGNLATIAGAVKAEDAVHASGDTGIMALAVRSDSEAALAGASGDYIPLMTDSSGKLRTSVAGTVLHDSTDAGAPIKIGGKASSSAPADVSASGDRVDAYFDMKGRLKVDASDVAIPVTTVIPGTAATNLGKAVDSAAGSTDTGVAPLAVRDDALTTLTPVEGDYAPLRVDANGGLWVSLATKLNSTDDSVSTVGTVAHDAADSGNPVKIGNKATAALSGVTLVAAGDRTDAYAGLDGVPIVRPHSNLEDIVSGNASNTDGTSTSLIAAAGSGIKTYITSVTITNTSASNIYVELKDGTTAKWTFPVPANGGVTHTFAVPLPGTANTAWNFDPSAAATTIYCSANGFKSKV